MALSACLLMSVVWSCSLSRAGIDVNTYDESIYQAMEKRSFYQETNITWRDYRNYERAEMEAGKFRREAGSDNPGTEGEEDYVRSLSTTSFAYANHAILEDSLVLTSTVQVNVYSVINPDQGDCVQLWRFSPKSLDWQSKDVTYDRNFGMQLPDSKLGAGCYKYWFYKSNILNAWPAGDSEKYIYKITVSRDGRERNQIWFTTDSSQMEGRQP